MKRVFNYFLVVFIVINTSSCSTVRVRTNAAQGSGEESVSPRKTLHRMFWGFVWNSEYEVKDCPSMALQQIHVKTNFWEGLVTVITLGIYCPVGVYWVCAKEQAPVPDPNNRH